MNAKPPEKNSKWLVDFVQTFEGKLLAVLMAALLVFSMLGVSAFAEKSSETAKDTSEVKQSDEIAVNLGEASVSFRMTNAFVVVKNQTHIAESLVVEAGKDLTFTTQANIGYAFDTSDPNLGVAAKSSATGASVPVISGAGKYTIQGSYVTSDLVVTVKAIPIASEETPIVEATPIVEENLLVVEGIEKGENATAGDKENMARVFAVRNSHTVTFNVNGAESQITLTEGSKIPCPSDPTLPTGMVSFLGWYQDGGATQFDFANTRLSSNITLVAKFSGEAVVQFENDLGDIVYSETVLYGEKATKPADTIFAPSDGKAFNGIWLLDGVLYNFDTPVTKNLTLTPKCGDTYLVEFLSGGGSAVDAQLVDKDELATKPADPTRNNYTFKHWSTTQGGAAFDFGTIPITANTTLYAVWDGNEVEYVVEFWLEKEGAFGLDFATSTEANDHGSYVYAFSAYGQNAKVGDKINLTQAEVEALAAKSVDSTTYKEKYLKYSVFHHVEQNVEVRSDGTTILHVYYVFDEYDFEFVMKLDRHFIVDLTAIGAGIYDADTWIGRNEYVTDPVKNYSIKVKLGLDVSGTWPNRIEYDDGTSNMSDPDSTVTLKGWTDLYQKPLLYTFPIARVDRNMLIGCDILKEADNTPTFRDANFGDFTGAISGSKVLAPHTIFNTKPTIATFIFYYECVDKTHTTKQDHEAAGCIWWDGGYDAQVELGGHRYIPESLVKSAPFYEGYEGKYYSQYSNYDAVVDPYSRFVHGERSGLIMLPPKLVWPAGEVRYVAYERKTVEDGADQYVPFFSVTLSDDKTQNIHYFFYDRRAYNLELEFNGGTGTSPVAQRVQYGTLLNQVTEEPTKDGFDFDGWFEDADFQTPYKITATKTMPYKDLKLYAKWVDAPVTATYLDGERGEEVASQEIEKNTKTTPPTEADGGFIVGQWYDKYNGSFMGWYIDVDGTLVKFDFDTPIASDTTLYARWKEKDFNLTYSMGVNAGATAPTDSNNYAYKADAVVQDAPDASKDAGPLGKFVGWQLGKPADEKGSGRVFYKENNLSMLGDQHLIARYLTDPIKVKFNPNGGTGTEFSWDVAEGDFINLADEDVFSRSGYTFVGWATTPDASDDIIYSGNSGYTVPEETTFYAIWEANPIEYVTVTVRYIDTATGWSLIGDSVTKWEKDKPYDVAAKTTVNIPGYTRDSITGDAVSGTANTNKVLTVWYSVNKPVEVYYHVTYDANGGSGAVPTDPTDYRSNTTVTLQGQGDVTRDGYTFLGWSLTPDGPVLSNFNILADTTVYARWQPITVPVVPIDPVVGPPSEPMTREQAVTVITTTLTSFVGTFNEIVAPFEKIMEEVETPLAGTNRGPACWVHYYIIIGLLVTAIYSLIVIARRYRYTSVLNNDEDKALRGRLGKDSLDQTNQTVYGGAAGERA